MEGSEQFQEGVVSTAESQSDRQVGHLTKDGGRENYSWALRRGRSVGQPPVQENTPWACAAPCT